MKNLLDLQGKRIVITGGSSGIGRATAILCSKMGAKATVVARREEELKRTLDLMAKGEHNYEVCDLADMESVRSLAENIPVIDGLVLNAGSIFTAPVRYINEDRIDDIFNLNIKSTIILVKLLLKSRKLAKKSSICMISSIASQKPQLGNSVYSATKGAVNSFMKVLALELSTHEIRVNAVLPGFIETDLTKLNGLTPEAVEKHKKNYPLGRFGKPEDVAKLCLYLLSDMSLWMTGSLLTIDGGYSLK